MSVSLVSKWIVLSMRTATGLLMRLVFRHPVNQACISSPARVCTTPEIGSSYTLLRGSGRTGCSRVPSYVGIEWIDGAGRTCPGERCQVRLGHTRRINPYQLLSPRREVLKIARRLDHDSTSPFDFQSQMLVQDGMTNRKARGSHYGDVNRSDL